mmetsp:Transcript_18088/g.59409  ORF Transcript_18088/g.59409 Transcript_18088/m.59409 type:complete len:109 (-) Transcript_18088:47-373(-)
MFVVWSCTRTYAALVFLLISVSGSFLLPTGNPILLLLWMTVTFGGGAAYFWFVPDHYQKNPLKDSANGKPSWLQDIGDFSISTDGNEIVNAIHEKIETEGKRFKKEKV